MQAWNRIDEKLPDHDQICLVCGKRGGMRVARAYIPAKAIEQYWHGTKNTVWFTIIGTGKQFNATHWMPLPEPPEEEVDDE